jgi:hypothetical protein
VEWTRELIGNDKRGAGPPLHGRGGFLQWSGPVNGMVMTKRNTGSGVAAPRQKRNPA